MSAAAGPVANALRARIAGFGHRILTMQRLHPGYWQRSAGAWLWCAECEYPGGGRYDLGACLTMKQCLKLNDAELRKELSPG